MSETPYEQKLEQAEDLLKSEPKGKAGQRFLWTLSQLSHSYPNMDVENLRIVFPKLDTAEVDIGDRKSKDLAYVIGHITMWFIVPTIVLHFLAQRKLSKS